MKSMMHGCLVLFALTVMAHQVTAQGVGGCGASDAGLRRQEEKIACEKKRLRVIARYNPSEFTVYTSAVRLSPDRKLVAVRIGRFISAAPDSAETSRIELRQVRDGRLLWSVPCRGGNSEALAFSSDGQKVAAGMAHDSGNNEIRILDTKTGAVLKSRILKVAPQAIAFSPDRKTLAIGSNDSNIRLWDYAIGKDKGLMYAGGFLRSLSFHPTQPLLASASYNWNLKGWKIWNWRSRKLWRNIPERGDVMAASFSPDGRFVASVSPQEGLSMRETNSGRLLWRKSTAFFNGHETLSLNFSPNSCAVLMSSAGNGTVWDVQTGKPLNAADYRFGFPAHPRAFLSNSSLISFWFGLDNSSKSLGLVEWPALVPLPDTADVK